ncbi:MAG: hypothetical protein NPIRA06_11600 [Nitrospirales bacterium]|nr:MAG: hypothetical protein NPIRA06_11600 [Nitrospirales bacterium]
MNPVIPNGEILNGEIGDEWVTKDKIDAGDDAQMKRQEFLPGFWRGVDLERLKVGRV